MNLKSLKEAIDNIYKSDFFRKSPEEIPVLITIDEPSIGGRAYSKIRNINMGFDWEANQLRIEPQYKLVFKGNSLNDAKEVYSKVMYGKTRSLCPRCHNIIAKRDKFCRHCGQRLK